MAGARDSPVLPGMVTPAGFRYSARMTAIPHIPVDEIERAAKASRFSGALSVAPLGPGDAFELAFGFADRANRIANTIETRFAMASGCKIFTAVAVGLLIEQGKIALDAAVAASLHADGSDFWSIDFRFGGQVTIRHLLNHTSGVPDYFNEEAAEDGFGEGGYEDLWLNRPCYGMRSISDFLPLFRDGAMLATPGTRFLYSNSGFILLGHVVEQVTRVRFQDFVTEHIFGPCGMTRSGYFAMDALPDNTALGYVHNAKGIDRTNIFSVPAVGGPDGGAFTTIGDMRRFWTALFEGRLLLRKMLDVFLAPAVPVTEREGSWHYGCGVWLRQERGRWIASVEGSDPGASMQSEVRRDDGLVVTVLSNTDHGAAFINVLNKRLA